jgi:hypothetical protein
MYVRSIPPFLAAALLPAALFAHGMDKLGPHGGVVRMPSSWHAEVVPEKKAAAFKVYLLDFDFANPTVKDSSVTGVVKQDGQDHELICTPGKDAFRCSLPDGKNLRNGDQIVLKAARLGVTGNPAIYSVPLRPEKG